MKRAGANNKVKVHYTGTLSDGTVFDSSRKRGPLELTLGEGRFLKGFEQAVISLAEGETRTVTIPFAEAYGPRVQELVVRLARAKFPQSIEPKVGLPLTMRQPDGGTLEMTITEVAQDTVTLDGNHPLSGQNLTFEIELLQIMPM